jgi:hypothetical protein
MKYSMTADLGSRNLSKAANSTRPFLLEFWRINQNVCAGAAGIGITRHGLYFLFPLASMHATRVTGKKQVRPRSVHIVHPHLQIHVYISHYDCYMRTERQAE